MKTDLIRKEDAIKAIFDWMDKHKREVIHKQDITDVIMPLSSAIIYCKDCKHRDPEDKKCDCGHDIMWQLPREDNWFCADAERKENG